MRGFVEAVPLSRPLGVLVVIVALFFAAILVSRLAGSLAGWLATRRALLQKGEGKPSTIALARLRRRETATSLTREWLAEDLLRSSPATRRGRRGCRPSSGASVGRGPVRS
jgi:hypothetical protein